MPRDQPLSVMQPQVNTGREDADRDLKGYSEDEEHQQPDIPQL